MANFLIFPPHTIQFLDLLAMWSRLDEPLIPGLNISRALGYVRRRLPVEGTSLSVNKSMCYCWEQLGQIRTSIRVTVVMMNQERKEATAAVLESIPALNSAIRLDLTRRRNGSTPQYNWTWAWWRMGNYKVDCKWRIKASNPRARLFMKLTILAQAYIPSWALFLDGFHPAFFSSQRSTKQMQRRVW